MKRPRVFTSTVRGTRRPRPWRAHSSTSSAAPASHLRSSRYLPSLWMARRPHPRPGGSGKSTAIQRPRAPPPRSHRATRLLGRGRPAACRSMARGRARRERHTRRRTPSPPGAALRRRRRGHQAPRGERTLAVLARPAPRSRHDDEDGRLRQQRRQWGRLSPQGRAARAGGRAPRADALTVVDEFTSFVDVRRHRPRHMRPALGGSLARRRTAWCARRSTTTFCRASCRIGPSTRAGRY